MRNRLVGFITVAFEDGHVEKCVVKERAEKGKQHFLATVEECSRLILKEAPKNSHVKLKYKGDFALDIAECFEEKKILERQRGELK